MPIISIIIPTFNSIKVIGPCLDSIFTQDYQNFEVIVVDNGSNDNTVDFIKDNYPQIILVENKKRKSLRFHCQSFIFYFCFHIIIEGIFIFVTGGYVPLYGHNM